MDKYRLLEHTADIGLKAQGKSMAEAFANAAYGLFSIITDLRKVRQTEYRLVEIEEADQESLLFEWLNHLIYIFDVENLLFKRFEIMYLDEKKLNAKCFGEKYDPNRHELKIGVKAATFYMMKVDKLHNSVSVIFDV